MLCCAQDAPYSEIVDWMLSVHRDKRFPQYCLKTPAVLTTMAPPSAAICRRRAGFRD